MNRSIKTNALHDGRYCILAKIGEGGFGTVYKARDQHRFGKIVAIKEINMAALSAQEKIAAFIIITSLALFKSLRNWYATRRAQRSPAQPQMLTPQQMQKRP